ncbi:MAG: nuclear transport factor 2 family protein [Chloroflexi bacterium]|nr:nuclear transport factor 2 family protein [Chloroflexota bacterium]
MTHPNEAQLRQAYADFGRGDLEAYWSHCGDDFAFNVPGHNRVAGSYRGHDRFFALIGTVMELTGGQFEEIVEDVLANAEHGVVLVLHRFPRAGRPKEYRSAHVYDIRDGKFIECWEQPRDQAVFDDAWA